MRELSKFAGYVPKVRTMIVGSVSIVPILFAAWHFATKEPRVPNGNIAPVESVNKKPIVYRKDLTQ